MEPTKTLYKVTATHTIWANSEQEAVDLARLAKEYNVEYEVEVMVQAVENKNRLTAICFMFAGLFVVVWLVGFIFYNAPPAIHATLGLSIILIILGIVAKK